MKGIFLIFFISFLTSCIKEMEFREKDFQPKLVVNGLLCPDSLVSINICQTVSILTSQQVFVQNAQVKLFKNGEPVDMLNHKGNGLYRSDWFIPETGDIIRVEVQAPGFLKVFATDTIPERVEIIEGIYKSGVTHDQYGDPHHDYEIIFRDPAGRNFYELFFITQYFPNEHLDYYSILFQMDPVVADPVLKADSEIDFPVSTFVFTDHLLNGQTYRMVNKFNSSATGFAFSKPLAPEENKKYAILRSASYAYYQYRKTWVRHYHSQQMGRLFEDTIDFLWVREPTSVYSNIIGGYGIFASYNQSYFLLDDQTQ
jgi:hypothetical protein